MTIDESHAFLKKLRGLFNRIADLPIPTISSVHGSALGGGLELALCAHLRVFHAAASVGLPEVRLGIIPGAGGTYRLSAVAGSSVAYKLMLQGSRIKGEKCEGLGLCQSITGDLEDEPEIARMKTLAKSIETAREITLGAPLATRAIVKALKNPSEGAEREAYNSIIETNDRNEALAAFREKRKPVFTGQ